MLSDGYAVVNPSVVVDVDVVVVAAFLLCVASVCCVWIAVEDSMVVEA